MTPYLSNDGVTIYCGNSLELLAELPADSVQCCVTSPPYWGLRDYGIEPSVWGGDLGCLHEWGPELRKGGPAGLQGSTSQMQGREVYESGQNTTKGASQGQFCRCGAWLGCLGLEPSPYLYVDHMTELFRAVRRVLASDGTLWMNLGDSYATGAGAVGECPGGKHPGRMKQNGLNTSYGAAIGPMTQPNRLPVVGLKPKDLVGIPWRVAFALQADGWYLRSDIIWHKPNPMPESVEDRPTRGHEYLFLLTKSERYYYNAEAIAESLSPDTHARYSRGRSNSHKWADGDPGKQTIPTNKPGSLFSPGECPEIDNGTAFLPIGRDKVPANWHQGTNGQNAAPRDVRAPGVNPKCSEPWSGIRQNSSFSAAISSTEINSRNKRTVWTIPTQPFPEAHFATFPEDLVTPCVLAGARSGDTVLDPFSGSATVGLVARRNCCRYIGIEMSKQYCEIARRRLSQAVFSFEGAQ